jgi:hypothetical protein
MKGRVYHTVCIPPSLLTYPSHQLSRLPLLSVIVLLFKLFHFFIGNFILLPHKQNMVTRLPLLSQNVLFTV